MTRIAYADLACGASGDMLLGALAHAGRRCGLPVQEAIAAAVDSLGLGCAVAFEEAERGGLGCIHAKVTTPGESFTAGQLRDAIDASGASERARTRAKKGLEALLKAEAAVHGVAQKDVHLHDLGSADTVADLIGAAAGLEAMGASTVAAAPVPAPRGWVDSQGGALPLPAPATLELLRGVPMYGVPDEVELVTPTAAAILVAHDATFGPMPAMTLEAVGVGAGTRVLSRPNVCRVLVGTAVAGAAASTDLPSGAGYPAGLGIERDVLLETNIDDQPPEAIAHALDVLRAAGAKDAWITPIVMKKSRAAFMLSVLVSPNDEAAALDALFRETTTLGTRRREVTKWVLPRDVLHVPVRGTNVRVKVGRIGDEAVTVSPEFDDCAALAARTGARLMDLFAEASEKARRMLGA